MKFLLLAQDLPLDPTAIGEKLSKAESTEEVLSIVVAVLLAALLAVVVFHVREARRWEDKYEKRIDKNEKTFKRVERAISALAGLGESMEEEE